VFRKKLRRDQVLAFFAGQPRCLVAMEACAGGHYWARELAAIGHETRLIAPVSGLSASAAPRFRHLSRTLGMPAPPTFRRTMGTLVARIRRLAGIVLGTWKATACLVMERSRRG
jgi:transposase